MEAQELFNELSSILKVQLDTFSKLEMMQKSILKLLDNAINFNELMTLLGHKEKLVLGVAELSEKSRPYIAEWMQRKDELVKESFFVDVENLLDKITVKVESIKSMDEKMTAILNPKEEKEQNPEDLLNAYRALL
jgi:hypothetical protein